MKYFAEVTRGISMMDTINKKGEALYGAFLSDKVLRYTVQLFNDLDGRFYPNDYTRLVHIIKKHLLEIVNEDEQFDRVYYEKKNSIGSFLTIHRKEGYAADLVDILIQSQMMSRGVIRLEKGSYHDDYMYFGNMKYSTKLRDHMVYIPEVPYYIFFKPHDIHTYVYGHMNRISNVFTSKYMRCAMFVTLTLVSKISEEHHGITKLEDLESVLYNEIAEYLTAHTGIHAPVLMNCMHYVMDVFDRSKETGYTDFCKNLDAFYNRFCMYGNEETWNRSIQSVQATTIFSLVRDGVSYKTDAVKYGNYKLTPLVIEYDQDPKVKGRIDLMDILSPDVPRSRSRRSLNLNQEGSSMTAIEFPVTFGSIDSPYGEFDGTCSLSELLYKNDAMYRSKRSIENPEIQYVLECLQDFGYIKR